MAYEDIIKAASERFKVPEALIKAFIRVESNWDPNATRYEKHLNESSYGLMQVLLSTARETAGNLSLTPNQLLQPTVNILTGTKYLARQLAKYPDPSQAFSAYNAGRPIWSSISPGKFANQGYVDKINKHWLVYRGALPYTVPAALLLGLGVWWLWKRLPKRA